MASIHACKRWNFRELTTQILYQNLSHINHVLKASICIITLVRVADSSHTLSPSLHACSVSLGLLHFNHEIQTDDDDATDDASYTEVVRKTYLFLRASGVCLRTGHCKWSQKVKVMHTPLHSFIATTAESGEISKPMFSRGAVNTQLSWEMLFARANS